MVYAIGKPVSNLCLILSGRIEITDEGGASCSRFSGPRNSFGERGLLRDGIAPVTATATEAGELLTIPADVFKVLVAAHPRILRFFRPHAPRPRRGGRTSRRWRCRS